VSALRAAASKASEFTQNYSFGLFLPSHIVANARICRPGRKDAAVISTIMQSWIRMSAPRFGVPSLRIRKRRVIGVHAAVQILFPTVCGYRVFRGCECRVGEFA